MDTLFSLPIAQSISKSIALCHYQNMPILVITHAQCRAAISLQGGHLLAWQPTNNAPVIWLSRKAQFQPASAIRGGVPVCWPWFGKIASPSHGFARTQPWQLVSQTENPACVTLTLQLTDTPETRKIWDHAFTLSLTFELGQTCELTLTTEGNFQSTAALHSYFYVEDIQNVQISGLGEKYAPAPNQPAQFATEETLCIHQALDRIYQKPASIISVYDAKLQRTLKISHQNASDIVVWNPWAEGAASMKDMEADGYKTMVCVEAARIHQPLISTPQKPASMSMKIEVIQ